VKGGCTISWCMEEWHFGKPSNPCKRGNTDVKTMMMMMMMMNQSLNGVLCFCYHAKCGKNCKSTIIIDD
jgi:hypothetical protein